MRSLSRQHSTSREKSALAVSYVRTMRRVVVSPILCCVEWRRGCVHTPRPCLPIHPGYKGAETVKIRQFLMAASIFTLASCVDRPAPVAPEAAARNGVHDHPQNARRGQLENLTAAQNRIVAEIRRSTARFHRIDVALAEGYAQASPCVSSPAGGMGHHYDKRPLVDGRVDPSNPEVLLYEPQADGSLRLVAVEFIVPAAAWDPLHDSPPMLGNRTFDDGRAMNIGGPPFPHYQLHVWLWRNNPEGMYARFNPTVGCEHAG